MAFSSLDILRVLVVDDDEVARNLIASHLSRAGYTNVTLLEDGEAAWQALKSAKFDLIVLDWKLPKLSGLALFNRIRRRAGYRRTPLLVVSGMLERQDFRLLQEFPCTELVEKPFTQGVFLNRLEDLRQETVWYHDNVALVDTVLDAVERDPKKVELLLKQVLKKSPNPIPLALTAARRLVRARLLKPAQALLEAVLKLDDQSVIAMNELGKVLHLLGQHREALTLLRSATKISPQNIARLCLMGEMELNLSQPAAAKRYFEQALMIDGEDTKAQAGIVVAENMGEMLAPDAREVPRSFASILNTMGITLVRTGQYAKGIEQYRAAMAFLHGDDDLARVRFNLGLGYLRWGKPEQALPWFQRSEQTASPGFRKSAAYVKRLIDAGAAAAYTKVSEAEFQPAEADVATTPTMHDDVETIGSQKVVPLPTAQKPGTGDEIPPASDDEIGVDANGEQVVL